MPCACIALYIGLIQCQMLNVLINCCSVALFKCSLLLGTLFYCPLPVLQYLFNVAGVADKTRADLHAIDAERMLECFQTNAVGPLIVVQQLLDNGMLGSGSTVANLTSKVNQVILTCTTRSHALCQLGYFRVFWVFCKLHPGLACIYQTVARR